MDRSEASSRKAPMTDTIEQSAPRDREPTDSPNLSAPTGEVAEPDIVEDWSGADIEQAYQKALAALEDVPWEPESIPLPPTEPESAAVAGVPAVSPSHSAGGSSDSNSVPPTAPAGTDSHSPMGPRLASGTERHRRIGTEEQANVSPEQVVEAALFVGGGPLTAKKLSSFLRGSADAAAVERTIDELNNQYVSEGRPYEIRLGDGGYRLELRPEFEKLRQRVYGSGPREVKLSQDILEVLALVAYQQPISQQDVESHGKQNAGGLLRQLLRRDLVALQRGAGGRKDVKYCTTPRFLTVFGLGSLDELPQPDDLARK